MPLPPDSCRCDEQEACDADATQVVASEQRGIPEPVLEHPQHQYCIRRQYRAESARRSDTTPKWGLRDFAEGIRRGHNLRNGQ